MLGELQKKGSRKDFLFALPRRPKGNGNQRQKAKDFREEERSDRRVKALHIATTDKKGVNATG